MKTQSIKLISALPIDDYDTFDKSIVLPPGMTIIAKRNNKKYIMIGDGNSKLSSLQLYALKTEEELGNNSGIDVSSPLIFQNELVTSLPVSVNEYEDVDGSNSINIIQEDMIIGSTISASDYELLYN